MGPDKRQNVSGPFCPHDGNALIAVPNGLPGSRCSSCQGLFLRNPEITTAIRQSGIDRDKVGGIHPIPPSCPVCGVEMKVWVLGNLYIDLCLACEAVWFDRGELEKANAYLGMDPGKCVDTRGSLSLDDFGILGGVASDQIERFETRVSNHAWAELIRIIGNALD
jgi:hypothetical protein